MVVLFLFLYSSWARSMLMACNLRVSLCALDCADCCCDCCCCCCCCCRRPESLNHLLCVCGAAPFPPNCCRHCGWDFVWCCAWRRHCEQAEERTSEEATAHRPAKRGIEFIVGEVVVDWRQQGNLFGQRVWFDYHFLKPRRRSLQLETQLGEAAPSFRVAYRPAQSAEWAITSGKLPSLDC